ncbi:FAD-binding protein [Roseivivax sp. CAU 1761]
MSSVFPPIAAGSTEELAAKMDRPADALTATAAEFNAACGDTSGVHPTELDGVANTGLTPPKTHWARPLTEPPFYGYLLKAGVTVTFLGLKVDRRVQCATASGPIRNLWAAGETMAGALLGQGDLAGFGITIGTVFGPIAGQEAAARAS